MHFPFVSPEPATLAALNAWMIETQANVERADDLLDAVYQVLCELHPELADTLREAIELLHGRAGDRRAA